MSATGTRSGPTVEPYRGEHGLDLSLDPALDEIVSVRAAQAAELEAWLDEVTAEQLAAQATGRFCVRDLDLIEAQDAE